MYSWIIENNLKDIVENLQQRNYGSVIVIKIYPEKACQGEKNLYFSQGC